MPRYRLLPSPAQQAVLLDHCAHARYVWNLAVEQHLHWRPGRRSAPGYLEQSRQLTEARAEHDWLHAGSQMVQRVTMDRAGRWHVAFAAIPDPVLGPGNGETVGIDRGVVVSAALSTGELLGVRQKAGLNREIMRSGWGLLVRRLQDKAPGRVEKINPAYTSQRCSACGHVAVESR
jgi:transposase